MESTVFVLLWRQGPIFGTKPPVSSLRAGLCGFRTETYSTRSCELLTIVEPNPHELQTFFSDCRGPVHRKPPPLLRRQIRLFVKCRDVKQPLPLGQTAPRRLPYFRGLRRNKVYFPTRGGFDNVKPVQRLSKSDSFS